MTKRKKYYLSCLVISLIFSTFNGFTQTNKIIPGELWPDNQGRHIQAHGGGIIKLNKTYYWYGEERRQGLDSNLRYVSCYSSHDLMNWEFRSDVIKMSDPDTLGKGWILERPKV